MKSPMYKKYDSADYFDYEFDYQADFKQFLEEAKRNECQGHLKTEPVEQVGIKGKLDVEKNSRKSWKNSLFSWFKTDKKNKSVVQNSPRNGTIGNSELRRGHFSGPVGGNGGGSISGRPRKPTSGPITGLFSSSKRIEDEVPYASLSQLNNAKDVQSYGPVYLVT